MQPAATQTNTGGDGGNGLTGRELVYASDTAEPGERAFAAALCPQGKTATGGGFRVNSGDSWNIIDSEPSVGILPNPLEGWLAIADNTGTAAQSITAVAVCYDQPS